MGCGGGHDKRLHKIGERDAGRVQRFPEAAAAPDVGVGIDVDDPQFAFARLAQIESDVAAKGEYGGGAEADVCDLTPQCVADHSRRTVARAAVLARADRPLRLPSDHALVAREAVTEHDL